MSDMERMGAVEQDILREIANIGAGHASSALSMLMETTVEQSVPEVRLVPLVDLEDILGGAERVVVGVAMQVCGDIDGYLLTVMDMRKAVHIIESIRVQKIETPPTDSAFSAMDESALKEAVNISGGSYLTAISQMTGLELIPSCPFATTDMLGAILSIVLVQAGMEGDYVLYFKSALFDTKNEFSGDLLLIPNQKSYTTLLKSLGCI